MANTTKNRGGRFLCFSFILLIAIIFRFGGLEAADQLSLDKIRLQKGFQISVFAEGVENARSLALGNKGTVFVGTRTKGNVYAVVDGDGDYRADEVKILASGLFMPNGVAFHEGDLYVAEVNSIWKWENIEERLDNPPAPVVINDSFPSIRHHGWKFIAFGPDGMLYVPVGAPCNICEPEDDERFASITRMNPDGTGLEIFARGVRNSVGFDWHPRTGQLWFTDNGRDMLGDDVPPDELNRSAQKGLHFGYPYCHGGSIPDPEFGQKRSCEEFVPPSRKLGPHVAAIGMRFYQGTMFPQEYREQILIAEHGSWNRSEPIGYRVSLVRLQGDQVVSYETFAEGWLQDGKAWGRPADLLVMPDGSVLLSDDTADVIYRITYQGN